MVSTVFLTPSMRTRVGFALAAARLGGSAVEVSELRIDPSMSAGESFPDALRTLTGMCDVVVTRTPFDLDRELIASEAQCPVVNGGDGGVEHPSQALIDLAALESLDVPLVDAHLVISGDLTMRAVRSLLVTLGRNVPGRLTLCGPASRQGHGVVLHPALAAVTTVTDEADWATADVLYLAGLPARRGDDELSSEIRLCYAFTDAAALPITASVLSPLPVIDEIAPSLRLDPRVSMFRQSDHGLHVRVALLEHVLV